MSLSSSGRYILDGHTAVPCEDLYAWSNWFEDSRNDRIVKQERIGDVKVSTVFLSIDHSFGGNTPLLFETMVFGGPLNSETTRYSTWEQAERGHRIMVERVKESVV